MNSLADPNVANTLDRLHTEARGDWRTFVSILPRVARGVLAGRSLMKSITPAQMKNAYIPVSRDEGRFLYATARAAGARRVVEFGTSFGISTIYLAAAVRDSGGGVVYTTEIEPNKCRAAEQNLRDAGLADQVTLLEGDAMQTLRAVAGPIDLVFLDGWKDLYIPVLDLLRDKLRPGALVLADNVNMRDAHSYVEKVRAPSSGFISSTLFGGRMEHSCLAT
jgi:predicted O-methyltransferase YrrM